ncbi:hypothetical protein RHMOL_Rhmol06G0093600 [Rhododendron molle]|uniref:Uncharacterized protein n=1 Tax=Rhododendron molle TaxID=49168 RepID=A0ACC0NAP8_RHOML|nr:hypothetical protein RHMOL_Rhmol06G0093600 [Rhododendron molle]
MELEQKLGDPSQLIAAQQQKIVAALKKSPAVVQPSTTAQSKPLPPSRVGFFLAGPLLSSSAPHVSDHTIYPNPVSSDLPNIPPLCSTPPRPSTVPHSYFFFSVFRCVSRSCSYRSLPQFQYSCCFFSMFRCVSRACSYRGTSHASNLLVFFWLAFVRRKKPKPPLPPRTQRRRWSVEWGPSSKELRRRDKSSSSCMGPVIGRIVVPGDDDLRHLRLKA